MGPYHIKSYVTKIRNLLIQESIDLNSNLMRLRESRNSVFSTCNLVTETELQLLFIGMINGDRVNNVTRYYALRL